MTGDVIKSVRKENGLSQTQLGDLLGYSRQSISHMETNRLKASEDFAQAAVNRLDCPELHMEMAHEFMNGASAPLLRGQHIERHRLALKEFAIREVDEVMEILHSMCLIKPPEQSTSKDKEQIEVFLAESIDAIAGLKNLNAKLAKEYGISMRKIYDQRKPVWKAKKWI